MKVNCIIVDDEPASRDILQSYIAKCDVLNLSETCRNAFDAAEALINHDVQLIFLDINMPRLSGMQFYRSLKNPPFVIFTTAYAEFAVEGFEVNAVDFLLKPFPFERFERAVNKAIENIIGLSKVQKEKVYISLKSDRKIHRIDINDIFHLRAVGDYVQVFFNQKSILVHSTLRNLLGQLPSNLFFRVHRSHAIAINRVETIEGNMLRLNGKNIPIGQQYRAKFLDMVS